MEPNVLSAHPTEGERAPLCSVSYCSPWIDWLLLCPRTRARIRQLVSLMQTPLNGNQ